MRLKGYIAVVLLAFIGVLSQHRGHVPNQELVLQFHGIPVNSDEAQNTIAEVRAQLEAIGVSNIQLKTLENGTLRISYYSDKDLNLVKRTFSEDDTFGLVCSTSTESNPGTSSGEKHKLSYQLDIFEIQKRAENHSGLNGVSVAVLKLKSERYFEPNKYFTNQDTCPVSRVFFDENKRKSAVFISTWKRHFPQKIPQVRAGPVC